MNYRLKIFSNRILNRIFANKAAKFHATKKISVTASFWLTPLNNSKVNIVKQEFSTFRQTKILR